MKRALIAVAAAAVLVAGCGGSDDPGTAPGDDATDLPAEDSGDAAGGTTMRVYTVAEVKAEDVTNPVHVSGLLINDGSGWKLCEVVLESYPPQCGGESLTVEGVDESQFQLEEANGVKWVDGATVVGNVEGDTLTITGDAASS